MTFITARRPSSLFSICQRRNISSVDSSSQLVEPPLNAATEQPKASAMVSNFVETGLVGMKSVFASINGLQKGLGCPPTNRIRLINAVSEKLQFAFKSLYANGHSVYFQPG